MQAMTDSVVVDELRTRARLFWRALAIYEGNHQIAEIFWDNSGRGSDYGGFVLASLQAPEDALLSRCLHAGMNQNELVYELMLDTAWSTGVIDPAKWLETFNSRRYNLHTVERSARRKVQKAWDIIRVRLPRKAPLSCSGLF